MSTPATPHEIEIDPETTRERLAAGALLVDVREPDEVAETAYDAPDVVNVPLSAFADRYTELPADRDLVIACRSGGRSMRATQFLHQNGYGRAVNMAGGIIRWQELGFPVR